MKFLGLLPDMGAGHGNNVIIIVIFDMQIIISIMVFQSKIIIIIMAAKRLALARSAAGAKFWRN